MLIRAHGTIAILLGSWEAAAFMTGRVPTISVVYARARRRCPGLAPALLAVWMGCLARHLSTFEEKP